ncbi:MAG: hypothetical protein ABSF82_06065 [Candidatus Bathyarchaeia archaeon]
MESESMDSNTVQNPVDDLYRELDDLKQKNVEKRTEIRRLRERVEQIVNERDALNSEVKRVSDTVRKLKTERDSLNAKVRELKQKRDEFQAAAAKKREALAKLLQQAQESSEELHGNMSELSREVKSLEWYIQTNPLAPKTEREIVAKISALEANLAKHRGLRKLRDKLLQLKIEVPGLRRQAQAVHQELTQKAEESEKTHTAMQEQVRILAEKKNEADAKHALYLDQNNLRHETITALRRNMARIDEIHSQIGEVKVSSKVDKAEKLKLKYKEAANEKLRTGRKLSLDEFRALMGDTLSGSDDE